MLGWLWGVGGPSCAWALWSLGWRHLSSVAVSLAVWTPVLSRQGWRWHPRLLFRTLQDSRAWALIPPNLESGARWGDRASVSVLLALRAPCIASLPLKARDTMFTVPSADSWATAWEGQDRA